MFRNPLDANEVRNRQLFPKNNSFCHRWRVLDNFSKSIDRQMFHLRVQGADNHRSLMAERFLQLYKSRYTSSRRDLIVDLAQDAMQFLNRRRQEHYELSNIEVTLSTAVHQLMDRCFKTLLSFSAELNTVLGMSELFITATEPEVKKRSNSSGTSIAFYKQAHLSTNLFRLVLEGRQDHICFYLIPSDNIMAIHDLARQYEPVTAWKAQFALQDNIYWLSPAGVLTEGMIDVECAELLRHLIETTQEAIAPGSIAPVVPERFDMMEVDPSVLADPEENVSAVNAVGLQSEQAFILQKVSSQSLGGVNELWKMLDQASPDTVSSNCSSQICERGSFSLSVSTGTEIDRVASMNRSLESVGETEDRKFTSSCDGTRTDSVPSLDSLFKASGVYTTAADDTLSEQTGSEPFPYFSGAVCQDVVETPLPNEAPSKRKRGVSTKRSTRKVASKRNKKKTK